MRYIFLISPLFKIRPYHCIIFNPACFMHTLPEIGHLAAARHMAGPLGHEHPMYKISRQSGNRGYFLRKSFDSNHPCLFIAVGYECIIDFFKKTDTRGVAIS